MEEALLAAALSKYKAWYGRKLSLIAEEFGSLTTLYRGMKRNHSSNIPRNLYEIIQYCWSEENVSVIRQQMMKYSINSVVLGSLNYPELLVMLPEAPYVLYWQGDLSVITANVPISCVGTRALTEYGRRSIRQIFRDLRGMPICLVSGLALGVDGAVHQFALQNSISTAAVLAAGLDRYEPVSHDSLAREILRQGCILSEYPPGVRPQKAYFLARNRIIAGLSKVTIVVEGKKRSGSLVTARCAATYGRDVGAVPGDIFMPNSEGPLQLLRDGATPITSSEDIVQMLGITIPEVVNAHGDHPIYQALIGGPLSFDMLLMQTDYQATELQHQLTLLELEGQVVRTSLGEFTLA